MTFVIGAACIDVMDRSCVEECPVDCIYPGQRMLYIHPAECIDCGACEPACPVEAIRPQQRLPGEWKPFQSNANDLFAAVGSPGGSRKFTDSLPDPDFVVNYPTED
jgi:NAD-dependent dihydropyrimidine dehydrogenase PreA subunit